MCMEVGNFQLNSDSGLVVIHKMYTQICTMYIVYTLYKYIKYVYI